MQVIPAVVLRHCVGLAVEREPALTDAIAHAADDGTEVGLVFEVRGQAVVPQHHVGQHTMAVGHPEFGHNGAVVDHTQHHPATVCQGVAADFPAVRQISAGLFFHAPFPLKSG
jgi:hypothetical protein